MIEFDGAVAHPEPLTAAVLTCLVLAEGEPVQVEKIYRDVWASDRKKVDRGSIHVRVNALRKALDPGNPGRSSTVLLTVPGGYCFVLERDRVDIFEFIDLVTAGQHAEGADAVELYTRALRLWRDRPLLDAADCVFARPWITLLESTRDAAERELAKLHLDAGRTREAAPLVKRLLVRHPRDNELHELERQCRHRPPTGPARRAPSPPSTSEPDPTGQTVRAVTDALAWSVASQWNHDLTAHELRESTPISLSWRAADASLMAVNPSGLDGSGELRDILSRAAGRLVVLGAPGAGKTMLLIGLVEDLLSNRPPGAQVPVPMSLTSWNPRAQRFRPWLIEQLLRHHPGPAAAASADVGAVRWVDALLAERLILPVLDGLDEMRPSFHQQAIEEISRGLDPSNGLVLACRSDDYRAAVRQDGGYPVRLNGAAGIELSDVDAETAAAYLRRDDPSPERWTEVTQALGTGHPVGQALRTPLILSLMRSYHDPAFGRHPADLCDTTRFPTAQAVSDALVDEYLDTADRKPMPGAKHQWSPARRRRALRFLAQHLDDRKTTELAWWRLRQATPRPLVGAVIAIICGLSVAVVVSVARPLTASLGGETHKAVGLGPGLGILVGLAVARITRSHRNDSPILGLAAGLTGGLIGGFGAGVANLLGIGKANWPAGGFAGALAVGAMIGPIAGVARGAIGGLVGGLAAGLFTSVGSGIPAGLVDGLGVGLAAGLTVAVVGPTEPTNAPRWFPVGLLPGAAIGGAIGIAAAVIGEPQLGALTAVTVGAAAAWVLGLADDPKRAIEPPSPPASLDHDARAFAKYWAAGTASAGVIGLLADGLDAIRANDLKAQLTALAANGLVMGLVVAIVTGIVLGGLHSAWAPFAISRAWLAIRGHLPWRLMDFLDDARQRGILRQLGPVHQFRHVQFQQRLAKQHRSEQP